MDYLTIKHLHLISVALSYLLFFVRGIWSVNSSPCLQQRWVKIAPHLNDTVLLASAVTLAVRLNLSPLNASWLLAKIIALLLYIMLGSIAIKSGKTRKVKLIAWFAAQAVFFYIVATAVAHDWMPWRVLVG